MSFRWPFSGQMSYSFKSGAAFHFVASDVMSASVLKAESNAVPHVEGEPCIPAPSEDLLIFPSSHDHSWCPAALKPCVRGPWRHTHTHIHTIACSANRHCVVIKERSVLSGWIGRAVSTCSGTVMTSGGRHPGGLGCCFTMHFLLPPAGGTIDWVMVLLIPLFCIEQTQMKSYVLWKTTL